MKNAERKLLKSVRSDVLIIQSQLKALSEKCHNGGERRIGWEIDQSIRALDEAMQLSKLYLSGVKLPTLAELRGILRQSKKLT